MLINGAHCNAPSYLRHIFNFRTEISNSLKKMPQNRHYTQREYVACGKQIVWRLFWHRFVYFQVTIRRNNLLLVIFFPVLRSNGDRFAPRGRGSFVLFFFFFSRFLLPPPSAQLKHHSFVRHFGFILQKMKITLFGLAMRNYVDEGCGKCRLKRLFCDFLDVSWCLVLNTK